MFFETCTHGVGPQTVDIKKPNHVHVPGTPPPNSPASPPPLPPPVQEPQLSPPPATYDVCESWGPIPGCPNYVGPIPEPPFSPLSPPSSHLETKPLYPTPSGFPPNTLCFNEDCSCYAPSEPWRWPQEYPDNTPNCDWAQQYPDRETYGCLKEGSCSCIGNGCPGLERRGKKMVEVEDGYLY